MFVTPPMTDAEWFAHIAAKHTMLAIAREQERKIIDFAAARAAHQQKKRRTVPKIVQPAE